MGKTSKANRTKGNTRPSSSGHSAELLGLNSRAFGGFVGFDALGKDAYVPVTGQSAAVATDNAVDSDFRMVMRKMLKRDAVTRLKAVQEFGDYCIEKDKEAVKNVLPFWPRLFNRLALDFDRRVREAAHQSSGRLFSKVGREAAPFLKGMMGVWLVGQCDAHPPAASAAQASFGRTFPPGKQAEAALFCREEVVAYFKDNLFEQTVKSMSEPNTATPEDMESKYNLVISATLQALKLFLVIVKGGKQNDAVREDVMSVVTNGKFWKFSKSKEPQIRSAWYTLVSSICQLLPDVFARMEKKLATTVFSCLSENDPIVASSIWECALSVAVNVDNCWAEMDLQKVALPQLWSLLEGGGKGNASSLLPCLLPLLAKLPEEVTREEGFLRQFFSACVKGLMVDSVKRSTAECDAILSAFFECLQFMCCTRLAEEGPKLMEEVLLNQVLPLLSSALHTPSSPHLAVSRLCPLLASLVRRLERTPSFCPVLRSFWGELLPVASGVFSSGGEQWGRGAVFLAFFFCSLFEGEEGGKEKKTVRFKDDEDEPPKEENEPPPGDTTNEPPKEENEPPPGDTTNEPPSSSNLAVSFPRVAEFCAKLCGEIDKEPSRSLAYLRLLEEILFAASKEDLLGELARRCLKDESGGQNCTPIFVDKIILKWMREFKMDDNKLNCLVNITLLACVFLSVEESKKILDACRMVDVGVVERLLRRGLDVCRSAPFFREWAGSSICSQSAVDGMKEVLANKTLFTQEVPPQLVNGSARVLELCLLDEDSALLINDETFKNLLSLLKDLSVELFATKFVQHNCDVVLMFLHDVTTALLKNTERCWNFATEELVFLLFDTFLKNVGVFENLTEVSQVLLDVLGVGIDSFVAAKETLSTGLIHDAVKELTLFMLNQKHSNEVPHLLRLSLFLLSSVRKSLERHRPADAPLVTQELGDLLLPSPDMWDSLRTGLTVNMLPFFLRKKIFPLSFEGEQFFYPQTIVTKLTLVTEAVCGILCSDVLEFKNKEGREETIDRDHVVEQMPHLLWVLTFCRGTRKRIEACRKTFERRLMKNCTKMLSLLQSTEIDTLKQNIFNLSLINGEWALCLQTLGEIFPSSRLQSFAEEQFESSSPLCMSEGLEKYMVRQVLIPHLPLAKKLMHFEELLIELLQMTDMTDKNFCGKMGEVCCYFQDGQLLKSIELEGLLMPIFKTIASFLSVGESDLHLLYHLQVEAIVASAIQRDVYLLNAEVWEFFMNQLSDLLVGSRSESFSSLSSPRSYLSLHRLLVNYTTLSRLYIHSREEDRAEGTLLDWKPPQMPDTFDKYIFHLFINVAMKEEKTFLPECSGMVLDQLLEAVKFIPAEVLISLLFGTEDASKLENTIAFLSSTVRQLQLSSHIMLIEMMPFLPDVLRDPPKPEEDTDENEEKEDFERIPRKLLPLLSKLSSLTEMVEVVLGEVGVGEPVSILPHTDSYCLCMAFLLAWTQLLEFIAAAPSQIRLGYATDLTEKGLLPSLFTNVFRLMPENPVLCLKKGGGVDTPKKEDLRTLFLRPCAMHTGSPSSEEIQIVACYVYAMALRKVPASVRTWFNNLDRKSADIVNNFTTKYVSGHLCAAEIQAVHEIGKKFENLAVHARPGSREVIATYAVDDASIELCIQLPPNHPLSPINTERRGRVGVGELEWRQWLLQLKTTLTYQNGSIVDGLSMWKRNLDKKFEGIEECMICYYVLHSASLKLPRLSCHVCRKKFHSECLYKWFRSSNNSTCPLCRNDFRM